MIRRPLKKVIDMIKDPSRNFKERVFILLTLVIYLVILIALAGDIAFDENWIEIISLIITAVLIPVVTFVSVKKNKVNLAARIVVIGLVFVLLPILFYFGGGIEGGGILWIIFAYLYTGMVLSGKWKPVILVILTMETILFYAHEYFYPDLIYHHGQELFYLDSLFSMILVGIVGCLMVWFEEWLYQEENKRVKEENKKIEELIESKSRFFSNMSHEIRTPINTILGLNEIILRQEEASEEILKDSRHIQGSGRMLLSLVNDILDLSKMEAGEMEIVPVNYNLENMLSDIVNIIGLRVEQKGLKLNIEIDPSIPAELYGDEMRIKQILINLLNNAVKYTQEGSVTLRIEKGDMNGDDILLLYSIIDTGIGIKQDAIPYLFDEFRRIDTKRNAGIEGTGLGLAIVKRLVGLMNGKITVSSIYTEGSTFIVSLRQKITSHDSIGEVDIQNLAYKDVHEKYMPGFIAPDARILIVDDNEMNLEVERKLIAETKISIDTVSSGTEALSMTLSEKYDVIFLDHLMPGMDGIECLQYIRKQAGGLNNQVPVIALTANAGSDVRELYNKSGFDGYLLKPLSGAEFEEMLLEYLPEHKVKRNVEDTNAKVRKNSTGRYSKKISVIVTTSSMCDLPKSTLESCQIDIIPFSINAGGKSYSDRAEASADEVLNYMRHGISFESLPPSVEDFERFFGKEIKKAHEIIYISLPSVLSKEYDNALEAAKEYGNVKVFDSGCNSGAMGLVALIAHRLAMQGMNSEKIIEELEKAKNRICCSFITGDAELMMNRGSIGKWIYGFMNTFGLRPGILVKNGILSIDKMYYGDFSICYEKYIEHMLPKKIKPDLDVIMVNYAELSEEGCKRIREVISRRFAFENIIFQNASAVMTLNCGMGALGISYLTKGNTSYDLGKFLTERSFEDEIDEEDSTFEENSTYEEGNTDEAIMEVGQNKAEESKKSRFEMLTGIDAKTALEYSGSEESLLSVMKIFYESIDKKADEIEDFYDKEDYKNYTIKVHALKSSSRLIGATDLGNLAKDLEMAGNNNDICFIKENHNRLINKFRGFKDILSPLFDNLQEDSAKADESQVNERFDSELLKNVYEGIYDATQKNDKGMIEDILDEIFEYKIPKEDMEKLKQIKKYVAESNFEMIRKLVN
ncbi:DegV family protein [Butyrivibrio sp. JL13D10]|uniref:DegV family protein n=1 Tax=Butyrivibrio sp. JL13D10 TaxID=3236815 RepID=UPI0038B43C1D